MLPKLHYGADYQPFKEYLAQIEHDASAAVPKLGARMAARKP